MANRGAPRRGGRGPGRGVGRATRGLGRKADSASEHRPGRTPPGRAHREILGGGGKLAFWNAPRPAS